MNSRRQKGEKQWRMSLEKKKKKKLNWIFVSIERLGNKIVSEFQST